MTEHHEDQDAVAAILASVPPPRVTPAFLARVNARIDADAGTGWLALADFRVWTLRLAPLAAALALIAVLWPTGGVEPSAPAVASAQQTFTPASAADWQQDVAANAMLEAALSGSAHAR